MSAEGKRVLANKVQDRLVRSMSGAFGPEFFALCQAHVTDFCNLVGERLDAKGLGSCVDCGWLTRDRWRGALMCADCQKRNPGIQQVRQGGAS